MYLLTSLLHKSTVCRQNMYYAIFHIQTTIVFRHYKFYFIDTTIVYAKKQSYKYDY